MSLLLATEMVHKWGKVIKSEVLIRAWWLLTHCVSAATEAHTCHLQGQQECLYSPWSCVRPRLAGLLGALPSSECSRFLGMHHLPASIFSPPPCISLPASIPVLSPASLLQAELFGAETECCGFILPSDLAGKYE